MRLPPLPVGSPGAAGALAVTLHVAASLRECFPLCLVLPFLGSVTFLVFVPLLEALSESLTHSFPRSFLVVALSASAVGFADALWLCPGRALCRFFASVSLFDPGALSPLLHRVFPDGFPSLVRVLLLRRGVSPCVWSRWGALGESRWLHLYRLTPDLVGLRLFAGCHWSSGRCFLFYCATFRRIHGDHLVSFTDSFVSPPYGIVPWTLAWRVTGWTSCPPPLYSGPLSFMLTYGHDSRFLMPPKIDIVWRWPCLPRLRWF